MFKIEKVKVLDDYQLRLTFDDGVQGIVDLSHLAGKGVFSVWKDYERFRRVSIGEVGELLWEGQLDLCPDALYLQITEKQPEDIFPSLRRNPTHA